MCWGSRNRVATLFLQPGVIRRFLKRRKRYLLLLDELSGLRAGWRRKALVAPCNIIRLQALRILALQEEEEAEEVCSRPPKTSQVSEETQVLANREQNHFQTNHIRNRNVKEEGFIRRS
jgi:hypothetical protein